jgi:hypothetical protein
MKSDPVSGRPRSASTPVVPENRDARTTGAAPRARGDLPSRPASPSGGVPARRNSDPLFPDAHLRSLKGGAPAAGNDPSRESQSPPAHAIDSAAMQGLLAERNHLLSEVEKLKRTIHQKTLDTAALQVALGNAAAAHRASEAGIAEHRRKLVTTHEVLGTNALLNQSRIDELMASWKQDRLVKDGLQEANNYLVAQLKELRRQQTALQNELARRASLPSSTPARTAGIDTGVQTAGIDKGVDRQEAKSDTVDKASALAKRLVDSTLEELVDVRSQLKDTKHDLSDTKRGLDDARRDAKSDKGTIDTLQRKVASLDDALAGKTAELKAAMQELAQRKGKGKKAPNANDGNAAEKIQQLQIDLAYAQAELTRVQAAPEFAPAIPQDSVEDQLLADLYEAIKRGDHAGFMKMIDDAPAVLADGKKNINDVLKLPLAWASRFDRPEIVALLIKRGVAPDDSGASGFPPIVEAARSGAVKAMNNLLKSRRADPLQKGEDGLDALQWAIKGHEPLAVERLVTWMEEYRPGDVAALLNSRYPGTSQTVFHLAIEAPLQIMTSLLECAKRHNGRPDAAAIDLDAVDELGKTAATGAMTRGRLSLAFELVKHGASVTPEMKEIFVEQQREFDVYKAVFGSAETGA